MTPHYVVTGSAGFIGSHLVKRLIDQGADVLGIDDLTGASPMHSATLEEPRYTFLQTDVCSGLREAEWPREFLDEPLAGIFHLACPASPVDYESRQIATLRTGALGTESALQLAVRRGARVVVTSTSEVYGNPAQHPQHESYWGNVNPIGPRSMYDEAKRYGEALCFAYIRERKADVGIVRLFNTYGPGMRPDDGRLIPTLIAQARSGEPLTVHGDGSQTRSFCYVTDTVSGLLLMMAADGVKGPINIGNPDERRIGDVAEQIRRIEGLRSSIVYVKRPGDDPDRRRPNIDRAKAELGWEPTIELGEGLDRTLAYSGR